jgi:chemotaxis protein CheC
MAASPLTARQRDALREVIGIGAAHAAEALSSMITERVVLNPTSLEVIGLKELPAFIRKAKAEEEEEEEEEEEGIIIARLKILGEVRGNILILISESTSLGLSQLITDRESHKKLDGVDVSVLRELGNILGGSCLGAINKMLDINLLQSIPEVLPVPDVKPVTLQVRDALEEKSDYVLALATRFSVSHTQHVGLFVFVFSSGATNRILDALEKKE